MILVIVAISIAILLLIVAVAFVCRCYRIFLSTRLLGLSTASEVDSVGGVAISILCPSPEGIATVVNLLGVRYPCSEVVVAIDRRRHNNLLLQLKMRYSLVGLQCLDGELFRSYRCCFRRLVVVASDSSLGYDGLLDLAARNAMYDYLMAVPPSVRLIADSLGFIADSIASKIGDRVDIVTTSERSVVVLSRSAWRRGVPFSSQSISVLQQNRIHINQIITLDVESESGSDVMIERARYNFWDFLALNIMKYRKKLLSLKKP